ncbi:MAG: hypothetical protein AB8E15_03525 [Bdellovibrionales bacterium]
MIRLTSVIFLFLTWSNYAISAVLMERQNLPDYRVPEVESLVPRERGKYSWIVSILTANKQFTRVSGGPDNNVDSKINMLGAKFSLNYNWFSLTADLEYGVDQGVVSSSIGEQRLMSSSGLIYMNLPESWYIRPFLGAGYYLLEYSVIKTYDENVSAMLYRAGFTTSLFLFDPGTKMDAWIDSRVFDASIILEARLYDVVDSTTEESKFELAAGLEIEF